MRRPEHSSFELGEMAPRGFLAFFVGTNSKKVQFLAEGFVFYLAEIVSKKDRTQYTRAVSLIVSENWKIKRKECPRQKLFLPQPQLQGVLQNGNICSTRSRQSDR